MAKVPSSDFSARLPDVRITPRNLGAEQQAVMKRSQAMSNIGTTLARHAEELRVKDNAKWDIALTKSNNEYLAESSQKLGEEGINVLSEYDTDANERKEKTLTGISDSKLRDMVSLNYDRQSQVLRGKLAGHSVKQKQVYGQQLEKGLYEESVKALRFSKSMDEVEAAVLKQNELHVNNNPNMPVGQHKIYLDGIKDSYTLSHFQELVNRSPAEAMMYYNKNEGRIRDYLTNDGLNKLDSMVNAAQRDAHANSEKADTDAKNFAFDQMNTLTRNSRNNSDLVKLEHLNEANHQSGVYGANTANQKETFRNRIDARRIALEKEAFHGRIMSGDENNFTDADYVKALDKDYLGYMKGVPPEVTQEERMGMTIDYLRRDRVIKMPNPIKRQFTAAMASRDQNAIKPMLILYANLDNLKPAIVEDFIGDVKEQAWWNTVLEVSGADRTARLQDRDISNAIEIADKNVFEVDDYKRTNLIKDYTKQGLGTKARADAADMYGKLLKSHAPTTGLLENVKLMMMDTQMPDEAGIDYENLLQQFYVYTNGDLGKAKAAADKEFARIYDKGFRDLQRSVQREVAE